MSIIVLDEGTIGKIAAGEVIERPLGAVKELLENSIDAGADKITIELRDGGAKLVKVSDNGRGMSPEDARRCWERHTTSKIQDFRDLGNVSTLGLRGEALASISAVSRFELITRTSKDPVGTKITVEGGKFRSESSIGASEGTTVVVKDLFYNLPVRKKFLKSTITEFGHIYDLSVQYALAYPEKSFRVIHDGKEVLLAPITKSHIERLVHIFGKELARKMVPISHIEGSWEVSGFTSPPSETLSSRKKQFFYINRRHVRSQLASQAIDEAYRGLVVKGKTHPIVVLLLEGPLEKVDVNVHPQKREVQFPEKEKASIQEFLVKGIKQALQSVVLIPKTRKEDLKRPSLDEFSPAPVSTSTVPATAPQPPVTQKMQQYPSVRAQSQLDEIQTDKTPIEIASTKHFGAGTGIGTKFEFIGQFKDTYILLEDLDNDQLLFLDIHAADERITYENLKNRPPEKRSSQTLLQPKILDLDPTQSRILKENLGTLRETGFELEPFGGNTWTMKAIPGGIHLQLPLPDLLDELAEQKLPIEEARDEVLKLIACHGSIRAGERLSLKTVNEVLKSLFSCENPLNCPHGRPTILTMPVDLIEKRFRRK